MFVRVPRVAHETRRMTWNERGNMFVSRTKQRVRYSQRRAIAARQHGNIYQPATDLVATARQPYIYRKETPCHPLHRSRRAKHTFATGLS
jgi:hypothetical protein